MVKYGFGTQDQDRVVRAIRVLGGLPLALSDRDVAEMENEMEMMVGVKSIYPGGWEWQLEVIYG